MLEYVKDQDVRQRGVKSVCVCSRVFVVGVKLKIQEEFYSSHLRQRKRLV